MLGAGVCGDASFQDNVCQQYKVKNVAGSDVIYRRTPDLHDLTQQNVAVDTIVTAIQILKDFIKCSNGFYLPKTYVEEYDAEKEMLNRRRYQIKSSGTHEADGLYTECGKFAGKLQFRNSHGFELFYSYTTAWFIGKNGKAWYKVASEDEKPPKRGWNVDELRVLELKPGENPVPDSDSRSSSRKRKKRSRSRSRSRGRGRRSRDRRNFSKSSSPEKVVGGANMSLLERLRATRAGSDGRPIPKTFRDLETESSDMGCIKGIRRSRERSPPRFELPAHGTRLRPRDPRYADSQGYHGRPSNSGGRREDRGRDSRRRRSRSRSRDKDKRRKRSPSSRSSSGSRGKKKKPKKEDMLDMSLGEIEKMSKSRSRSRSKRRSRKRSRSRSRKKKRKRSSSSSSSSSS